MLNLVLILVWTFFVLSSGYRYALLGEIYYLTKNFNFTREDILNMPIFERRFYLDKFVEEIEKRNKEIEQARNKSRR